MLRFSNAIAALTAFIVVSGPVSAADQNGPKFRVTGIAANETLQLREFANEKTASVLEIPHDASGLIGTGRSYTSDSQEGWIEVTYQGKRGWVISRFIVPMGGSEITIIGNGGPQHSAQGSPAVDAPPKTPARSNASSGPTADCNSVDTERKLRGCTQLIKNKALPKGVVALSYSRRSDSEVELGRLESAIDDRAEALKLQPGDKVYKRRLSLALLLQAMQVSTRIGKAALSYYDKSITVDPENSAALFSRGRYYLGKNDFDKALTDLIAANEREKANSLYRSTLAVCYDRRANQLLSRNDLDGAIRDYGQAIAIDSKNASFFVHRGFANALKKNLDIALLDYSQAITLQPSNLEAYVRRAELFERTHDPANAISDLSVVLLGDPKNVEALLLQALANEEIERREDAARDYRAVLEVDASNPIAKEGLNRVSRP